MVARRLWLILIGCGAAAAQNFAFWQLSDVHIPVQGSPQVLTAASGLREIRLEPQGLTAPAPAFTVVTGDVFEFGPGDGAWERWTDLTRGWPCPIWLLPGNHDNTWWSLRPQLQRLYAGLPTAFEHDGVLFLLLDSAGRQDPRPSFAAEELAWVRARLAGVSHAQPIIVACHHPLNGTEWASPYDYERLIELLQPYNVVLMLVGHGHGHRRMQFGSFDAIMGGSTFDKNAEGWAGGEAGFVVVDLRDGMLRAVYKRHTEPAAMLTLIEKPLAPRPLPPASVVKPAADSTVRSDSMPVEVTFAGAPDAAGTVCLDEGEPLPLSREGERWSAVLPLAGLPPGRHVVRAKLTQVDRTVLASREFELVREGGPRRRWRVELGAGVRAPLVADDASVYVAAQDGTLTRHALDDGTPLWSVKLGGEVLGGLTLAGERLVVGSTDGLLSCFDRAGQPLWRYDAGAPLVAPPTVAGEAVYVGGLDGSMHAAQLADGSRLWSAPVAGYTIESPAVAAGDTIYVGAWDTFIYALDAATGAVRWKQPAAGARAGAARYYSPADAPPVVLGELLLVPDRNYQLGLFDRASGELRATIGQTGAAAPTADGQGAWLRRFGRDGRRLTRLNADGGEAWSVPIDGGSLPVPPREQNGRVLVTSDDGLVSVLSAADGALQWQYRAAPGSYVPGGAVLAGDTVCVAALDGSLTAVTGP